MATMGNMGWIPDKFDGRDKPYTYKGPANWLEDFNNALAGMRSKLLVDMEPEASWLKEVYDQSESGSCVANAVAASVRFLACKTNGPASAKDPSRLFIYYNARATAVMSLNGDTKQWPEELMSADKRKDFRDFSGKGGGSYIRDAFKSINIWGVAPESAWPFQEEKEISNHATGEFKTYILRVNDRPVDAAYQEAKGLTALEYCRLDPPRSDEEIRTMGPLAKNADGILTLARLKQCLIEGYPVAFGFSFYHADDAFIIPSATGRRKCNCCDCPKCQACEGTTTNPEKYPSLRDIPPELLHKRPPRGEKYGAHAVLAVGFEDLPDASTSSADAALRELKGRVLVQNSWGSYLSYFWIPYTYIIDFYATSDFWMLRELNPAAPKGGIKMAPGWDAMIIPRSIGENGLRKTGAQIAAVSRKPNLVEVFWTSLDGRIQGGAYDDTIKEIRKFSFGDTGSAVSGSIAAVSRDPKSIDVFWIDAKGNVRGARYTETVQDDDDDAGWKPYTSPIASKNNAAALTSPITAVSRKADTMEVWWLTADGSVRGAWIENTKAGGRWTPYQLTRPQPSTSNESLYPLSLKAISTNKHHIEVLCSYNDGTVKARVFDGNDWDDIDEDGPANVTDNPNEASSMTGLAAARGEVFFVMPDGTIPRFNKPMVLREVGAGWTRDDVDLAPRNSARVDSGIAALTMGVGATDVYWVGANNSLRTASVRLDEDDKRTPRPIAPAGTAAGGTPLVAVKRGNTVSVVFSTSDVGIVIGSLKPEQAANLGEPEDTEDEDDHGVNGTNTTA